MLDMDLLRAAGKLKRVTRQGWLDAGITHKEAESVADHSFRTALIVAFQKGPQVDVLKAVRMALVHDLAEAMVGDITPRSGVLADEKARMEEEALRKLGNEEAHTLWKEYSEGETPEAKLVAEADALEMLAQAREYEEAGHPGRALERFWEGWSRDILSPGMRVAVRKLMGEGDPLKKPK